MQFVLISLVILPVLPNQYYGPGQFNVFNPRKIWLMVVLIVGISLAGYVGYKLFGKNAGTLLSGVLGGVFNALVAPVVFNQIWEYPLVLALACLARPWPAERTGWQGHVGLALRAVAFGYGLLYLADQPNLSPVLFRSPWWRTESWRGGGRTCGTLRSSTC